MAIKFLSNIFTLPRYSTTCNALVTILFSFMVLQQFFCIASSAAPTTNTEFIRTSCSATLYPNLCYTTLSSHASAIQQSPKMLAHTALSISIDTARATSTDMVRLSQGGSIRMTPREVAAMRDCVEELSDTVDRLRSSMAEMNLINGKNYEMMMSDIQTWVSAALTDEDTCMEGFGGKVMNGPVKNTVRGKIVNVAHITSNALALINSYSDALHK